jgi:outer membrane receptor for ferric coprogen and ferric-rhodotorulic acid
MFNQFKKSVSPTLHQRFNLRPLVFAMGLGSVMSIIAMPTLAQSELAIVKTFNIPAGTLDAALVTFGQQSGVLLSVNGELSKGKSSKGVTGVLSIKKALQQLLLGTNLQAIRKNNGSYTISPSTQNVGTLAVTQVIDAKSDQDKSSYTANSMNSATGLTLSLRETPQSVTVITRQVIDDFALVTVDAVLANTPGININRAETDRAFPTARGFSINYLQVDGVSSEANGAMNSDFLADTAIYERVEIIRGAAGILSGAGNPSATINLIRKRPTTEFKANVNASAGSWDAGRIVGDVSGSLTENGAVRGRIVAAHNSTDSYIDFYSNDKTVLYGVAEFDITDSNVATVGIDYQKEDVDGTTYGEPVPFFFDDGTATDFDRSVTTGAPWTFKDKERTTLFADISHEFSNGWQVKAAASRLEETMDSYLVYQGGYINKNTGAGLTGYTNDIASDRDLNSFSLSANGNFSLFGREHELLVGWNQTTEKISRLNHDTPSVAIDNFYDWPVAFPGNSDIVGKDWGWENKQSGAYLSSRWSLSEPLTLLVGTRLSSWESEEWDNGVFTTYQDANVLLPYLGLVYNLNDVFSLYSSYTEVFSPQYDSKDRSGNYLDPEQGINLEAGIKGEFFDGSLNSSFAIFQVEKDNVAEADIMVDNEQTYKSVEGVNVKGFEAELNGELFTGLNILAGYTYRKAEEKNDNGNTVISTTNEPEHMLRLNGNYQFLGELKDLIIGAAVRWQSEIYSEGEGPNGENAEQSASIVADIMARYNITDTFSASININNVSDKKYYSSVPVYNAGYYGAPRNATISVSASF